MIAADVHGKNHHCAGGLGDYLEELKLALPGGEIVICSRNHNAELFAGTVGGMGLTGTIIEATFRLRPIETGWMRQRTVVANDLDGAMAELETATGISYSVAWIDGLARGTCLGRSLVYLAEHATRVDISDLRPGAEPYPVSRPSEWPFRSISQPGH
jgi:FAD/FMN-containing dehydrogenase